MKVIAMHDGLSTWTALTLYHKEQAISFVDVINISVTILNTWSD